MKTIAKASKTQPTKGKGPLPPSTKPKQGSTSSTENPIGENKDPVFGIDLTATMWDNYPLVEIIWVDAVATAIIEWSTIEEIIETEPAASRAIGYLIHRDNHKTILTALVNETDAAHAMVIPNRMIHTITNLKPTK